MNIHKFLWTSVYAVLSCLLAVSASGRTGLTLIPPGTVTDKVDVDIRAGIVNESSSPTDCRVSLYLDSKDESNLLKSESFRLAPGKSVLVRHMLDTDGMDGVHKVILEAEYEGGTDCVEKKFRIIQSETRSSKLIDGAWVGLYHWSETEGRHWNSDLAVGMDIIVVQEVFRNEEYVGKHSLTLENYRGRAFYPSDLYPGRMPVASWDPLEAILSRADSLSMSVFMGVGMFAWFDFTEESLEWHKKVACELWNRYGHHPSFYGFYISEESPGNLCNYEKVESMRRRRKKEIVDFFSGFKDYISAFAPEKPVMLATNSMGVAEGADTYPALLRNLDILCPFGFARMPSDDIPGKTAADILQYFCDRAGSHLWFDLEAFLFNQDGSLYPRPIEEIVADLDQFGNFEKILCYQFPGVFSDPSLPFVIGEDRTLELYREYSAYRDSVQCIR